MKIFLVGSPYWCKYLSNKLENLHVSAKYIPAGPELFTLFFDRRETILVVGLGVAGAFKRWVIWLVVGLWKFFGRRRHKVVVYWIGSDVQRLAAGEGSQNMISLVNRLDASHIAGAPWFVPKLKKFFSSVESVLFPYDDKAAKVHASDLSPPNPYKLMAYLSKAGWANMKGDVILRLASHTPEIDWYVLGLNRHEIPTSPDSVPVNIRFMGWVSDPLTHMAECHGFIRLVDHDAYSGMVRDAKAMGKDVIYSMPIAGIHHVAADDFDGALELVRGLSTGHICLNESAPNDLPNFEDQLRALKRVLASQGAGI